MRSRRWPERPVSAANKSGSDTNATQLARTYSRLLKVRNLLANGVELIGLEPTTPCLQSRCSSQLSYSPGLG